MIFTKCELWLLSVSPSILRIVNDKLMQLERAFIIPDGVPESYSK